MKHKNRIGPFRARIFEDGLPVDQIDALSFKDLQKKMSKRAREKWS